MKFFDPIRLAEEIEKVVTKGELRKYYRTARPGRWYGGIASADCCGCSLRCAFCWSGAPRDNPETIGRFYQPDHIFKKLDACARKFGYSQLRVSGNEPTIGRQHLFKLLDLVDRTDYSFILETNGLLIGHDKDYAKQLSRFKCLHVRVSIKGVNEREFSTLTGATHEAFDLQLKALGNLLDANVSCHPAVMLSFSSREDFDGLLTRLGEVEPSLPKDVEEEYVFLYPHVKERLRRAGIEPKIAYAPNKIPPKLV